MSPQPDWTLPNPDAVLDPGEPPLPDTEALLSELGASYPIVAYPAQQDEVTDDAIEETIYAGLVFP
jgi:hypothetical protein